MINGHLSVITGCMFSGKTETLIRQIKILRHKRKAFVFKPEIDQRNGPNYLGSHSGMLIPAQSIPIDKPKQIANFVLSECLDPIRSVIVIDEAQFFSPEIIDTINILLYLDYQIIVAGLDLDFRGEFFGSMPQILALADSITKRKATCIVCGELANRTQRIIDGKPAPYNSKLILIGGSDQYQARCLKHHIVPGKSNLLL